MMGRRYDSWVRHYSWVDSGSTARLKTGADESESKSNLRRSEFFALPIRGVHTSGTQDGAFSQDSDRVRKSPREEFLIASRLGL